uniref:Reverse transcriptase domain-containing protein n=1 Tax=Solanum lycopersicum TaxID=4081 RepID=A0A3Q7H7U3_SOLLC
MDNIEDHSEEQIFKLLKDAASSEGEDDDNGDMCNPKDESEENCSDEDINLDYDSNSSQSEKGCTCTEAFCTCRKELQIRVLSDNSKEALFDVIQHINDDEARNSFLLELKNLILNTDKPKSRPIVEPFSMKQIMNRSENHYEPTIADLRHEVSLLKNEIREIKSHLSMIETDTPIRQISKKPAFLDYESRHSSSKTNSDNEDDINQPDINNNHLVEPEVFTQTNNNASTSATLGLTIRYPIPNKRDLLKMIFHAKIFSQFDMKSGFWQIQIFEKDKYKTAFNVPFGQFEWNVMPFRLKNAPSEFQNIMNSIFNDYSYMLGPKQQGNSAVQNTEKVQTSQKKLSKATLKQKLKEAIDNIADHSEEQIFKLLKDAASSEGEDDDNGDMCNPKGLALAYMDPDYE